MPAAATGIPDASRAVDTKMPSIPEGARPAENGKQAINAAVDEQLPESLTKPVEASATPSTSLEQAESKSSQRNDAPTIIIHDAAESSSPKANGKSSTASRVLRNASFKAKPKPKPILSNPKPNAVYRPATSRSPGDPNSFLPITTSIPTGSLDDLISPDKMSFSNRGSIIMLDGDKRWSNGGAGSSSAQKMEKRKSGLNGNGLASPTSVTSSAVGLTAQPASDANSLRSSRVLSADEMSLSAKVRNMYEYGVEDPLLVEQTVLEEDETEDQDGGARGSSKSAVLSPTDTTFSGGASPRLANRTSPRHVASRTSMRKDERQPYEMAGGIEDWENVKGDEIDRYGFIVARKTDSRGSTGSGGTYNHNVTTSLLEASKTPRRKQGVLRRVSSRTNAQASYHGDTDKRKSGGSQANDASSARLNRSVSTSSKNVRGKHKRALIEAPDMLTLPPGVSEEAASTGSPKLSASQTKAQRHKEWEREVKWKKMGRLKTVDGRGGGMQFDFDPRDPKVISRTWKGIPDRWRATAWYSFLESSAKKNPDSLDEGALVDAFHELQPEASADDVQIDCDVPRTINRHIMFRRRYRGGQRLLFRVLHALSLHFPEVGYVQGMAALAATLLCYYDEERTFVMMVRLWQLRGLERLYQSGFEGLFEALGDFETEWLGTGDVAKKLEELGIEPTAYGTRWYLTLFNYSIPFPAQLRVWDVFMLLGDEHNAVPPPSESSKPATNRRSKTPTSTTTVEDASSTKTKLAARNSFGADLDVLHATSAALIDATRDILLKSDFENAMKVLTSWIPVKDEDLLMKVACAEWKARKKRGGVKVLF